MVNLSISTSTVPALFKEAIVTPILKKANADLEYKNYRPISNLSFISKLCEKAISIQMKNYIESNHLGEPLQSAYTHLHSTQTALIKVFDDLLTNLDQRKVVLLTLLDLSAAFNTVEHAILLKRLQLSFG